MTSFEPFSKVICPHCEVETRVKRKLGKYYLERRYAVGGMSVIYLAIDETLGREVAVKILNEQYSVDEVRVEAFEREAKLTAAVNHPNVVKIYTVGKAYDRYFLVMELIKGQSFEAMMTKRGALPEAEVLDIALEVAEGLRAANESGVLHRDVKPGNILLTPEGSAKLVDFGLALITHGGAAQAEEVWATPYYVPPEALDQGEEDFRSDLYAFGATLYHALSGKPPFESTTTSRAVLKRAKQTIPRLSKVAPWLGSATCEAIDRMMAFQPKHRWESYDDLVEALRRARVEAADSEGIPIHGEGRAARRAAKSRWMIPVVAAAVVAVLGAGLWKMKPWEREPEVVKKVEEPRPIESVPVDHAFDESRGTTEAWAEARDLVFQGDYDKARGRFIEISEDGRLQEPSQSFALLEGAVSALLNGEPGKAREEARVIRKRLKGLSNESATTGKLIALSEVLATVAPPPEEALTEVPQGIVDWVGAMAVGLKLWEQGLFEEAIVFFEKVRGAEIESDFSWYPVYQSKVEDYLADAALLGAIQGWERPLSIEEAEEQMARLAVMEGELKTKGRAGRNLKSLRIYLMRVRKGLELRPGELPGLGWSERTGRMDELCARLRFGDARILLNGAGESAPPKSVEGWNYFFDQAKLFYADLKLVLPLEVKTRAGGIFEVTELSGKVLTGGDGKSLSWSEVDVASLLELQRSLHGEEPSVAARERAIAFEWLVGMRAEAEAAAEKLAAEDQGFRAKWREVLIALSH